MSEATATEVKEEVKETVKAPIKKAVTAFKIFLSAEELKQGKARLTTAFRCDKGDCPAHAAIESTLKSGRKLYWCAHHGRELEAALKPHLKRRGGWYSEEIRYNQNKLKGSEN